MRDYYGLNKLPGFLSLGSDLIYHFKAVWNPKLNAKWWKYAKGKSNNDSLEAHNIVYFIYFGTHSATLHKDEVNFMHSKNDT